MSDTSSTSTDIPSKLEVTEVTITKDAEIAPSTVDEPQPTGYVALQDMMGLSRVDDAERDKLQYIWDYFGKGRERADTLEAIKDAQQRLAPPAIGENYLHKLYAYTTILKDIRDAEREKKTYQR